MKTQLLPQPVEKILSIGYYIFAAAVLAAIAAKLFGWIRDPVAFFLRLPLFVLILVCVVISAISAEIIVLAFSHAFTQGAGWSVRTQSRVVVVLWILFALIQIACLILWRSSINSVQPTAARFAVSGG